MTRQVSVVCNGCDKTQTLRPSRIERCDGYCCTWPHGPKDPQVPGLIREWIYNAAGGFDGWRDVVPTVEQAEAVARARAVAVLGATEQILDDAP